MIGFPEEEGSQSEAAQVAGLRIRRATDAALLLVTCASTADASARDPSIPEVHHAYAETLRKLADVVEQIASAVADHDPGDGSDSARVGTRHPDAVMEALGRLVAAADSLSTIVAHWDVPVSPRDAGVAARVATRLSELAGAGNGSDC